MSTNAEKIPGRRAWVCVKAVICSGVRCRPFPHQTGLRRLSGRSPTLLRVMPTRTTSVHVELVAELVSRDMVSNVLDIARGCVVGDPLVEDPGPVVRDLIRVVGESQAELG